MATGSDLVQAKAWSLAQKWQHRGLDEQWPQASLHDQGNHCVKCYVGEDEIRLESITDSMDMNLSKLQEIVKDRGV